MRHILIILSIILLYTPLFGQETGVLYLYETSTGIKWETFGKKETHLKYKGDVENGEPNGFGVLTHPNGDNYVGEFKGGFPNGQGTLTSPDGWKYVGEFKNGIRNGQGTETYSSGNKYVGEFKDGNYHGQGTFTFTDGRKKLGEFREGKDWNVIGYDQNGNEKTKWVNGKLIEQ